VESETKANFSTHLGLDEFGTKAEKTIVIHCAVLLIATDGSLEGNGIPVVDLR
jgi:hypothetical protein